MGKLIMREIRHRETLLAYDTVQLFVGADAIGTSYLCMAVVSSGDSDRYLAIGISPRRLREFKSGRMDLRTVIESRELPEWFVTEFRGDVSEPLSLEPQEEEQIPGVMLPDPGFTLNLPEPPPDLAASAKTRNTVLLEVGIAPEDWSGGPRMRAAALGEFLLLFQSLVKHAYAKAAPQTAESIRQAGDQPDAHVLDFVGYSSNHRLMFEPARPSDLFGCTELQAGLEKLDDITRHADSPEMALAGLQENKGHLAAAYIRLLQFMSMQNTSFTYSWATPLFDTPRSRSIARKCADPLLEAFSASRELAVEKIELIGRLTKADSSNNTWRIECEDGAKHSGKTMTGTVCLSNLVIDRSYRFICEERLEQILGSGREIRNLHLVEWSEKTENKLLEQPVA